jgi:hypothetical protein
VWQLPPWVSPGPRATAPILRAMSRIHRITITAAALALAAPAAASAAVLAPYDGSQVAQLAGVQAWSKAQGDGYVLMIRSGGRTAPAAADAQPVPFAVSLGEDAAGRRLAVYPRCARVSGGSHARCHLVAYDLTSRRERAIAGTHAPGASEDAVALDRGILAYARRVGKRSTILITRLRSRRPARVAARVPAREAYVTGIALSPRALSFTVDAFPDETGESRLYVKPAGGAARQVARGGYGEENRREHLSPSIAGRYVYWAYANQSEVAPANGLIGRCDLLTGRTTAAPAPGYLDAVAADPARPAAPLVVSSFSQKTNKVKGTDQVATLAAPSWRAAPAALGLARGGPCKR